MVFFSSSGSSPPLPDEDSWILYWAKYAWAHAASSRLCAPQMVGYPINFVSYPGHYLHPLKAYSGKMSTVHEPGINVLRHAAMLNQLSASSSRIPPQQANSNDGGMLNQTSAFNLGTHASAFVPWRADSTLALAFGELSLGQSGSEQMVPQELMQNGEVLPTEDIKGKRPASEAVQQKLQVYVACLIAEDGTTGAAGLLIKNVVGQFICASCFPMQATLPALMAAACCEGIKIAQAYQPTTVLLETHLFDLLWLLRGEHTRQPEMEELTELLDPPRCTIHTILEESNGAARRMAMRGLQTGVPEIFFSAPPDWLVLT